MKKLILSIAALLPLSAPAFAFDQWQTGVNTVTCEEVRWQHNNVPQAVFTFKHKSKTDVLQAKLVGTPGGGVGVAEAILIEACGKYDTQRNWRPDLLVTVDNILAPIPHIIAVDWVAH